MKLKELEKKHDHKLTEWLKVIIFSLLMLAPLFASISQMIYVSFNKNAYQSYYGETINEKQYNKVQSYNDLQNPNLLTFFNDLSLNNVDTNGSKYFTFDKIIDYQFSDNRSLNSLNGSDYTYCIFYFNNGRRNFGFVSSDSSITTYIYADLVNFITFENFQTVETNYNDIFKYYLYITDYNKNSYLDNAFYYGVDQMTKSELFNWTQNTAVYTGVKAMTDNLQIQTPVVAILIVYWFILTIIYIIIDIVLALFTKMTHLLN